MLIGELKNTQLTLRYAGNNASQDKVVLSIYDADPFKCAVCGVYGVCTFNRIDYLVLVTSAEQICLISGKPVFKVTEVKILAMNGKADPSTMSLLNNFFSIPGIYFSDYPLYLRHDITPKHISESEFIFNNIPLKNYLGHAGHFGLRCIQGFVGAYKDLILISRRSYLRVGVRYLSRGCDDNGNCSNFVETEQIVANSGSYLQIRGSIPLRWSHVLNWRYNPAIITYATSPADFQSASNKLAAKYTEEIVYLNLIRELGYEEVLFKKFSDVLSDSSAIHFNFHKRIKNEELPTEFLRSEEYNNVSAQKKQKLLVRTNCMDCLDRTNAAQYFIGRHILEKQLNGFYSDTEIEEYRHAFKQLFLRNGDYLSKQYAGTCALSSYHISGGSYVLGRIIDILRSIQRYYINRVPHKQLQIAYEIVARGKREGIVTLPRRNMMHGIALYLGLLMALYMYDGSYTIFLLPVLLLMLS